MLCNYFGLQSYIFFHHFHTKMKIYKLKAIEVITF